MAAIVRLYGQDVRIANNEATSADKDYADLINLWLAYNRPTGYEPDRDYWAARELARMYKGEVIHVDEPDHVPGRIY